jgi:hypothetical protein
VLVIGFQRQDRPFEQSRRFPLQDLHDGIILTGIEWPRRWRPGLGEVRGSRRSGCLIVEAGQPAVEDVLPGDLSLVFRVVVWGLQGGAGWW